MTTLIEATGKPNKRCGFKQVKKTVDGRNLYVFVANCPRHKNRAIRLSITDTVENWENVIEHCGNVITKERQVGNKITKTYAVLADAGSDTVALSRPTG